MSTERRPLGTGPSTTRSVSTTLSRARLLPAERIEQDQPLDQQGQRHGGERGGRRALGTGVESASPSPISTTSSGL